MGSSGSTSDQPAGRCRSAERRRRPSAVTVPATAVKRTPAASNVPSVKATAASPAAQPVPVALASSSESSLPSSSSIGSASVPPLGSPPLAEVQIEQKESEVEAVAEARSASVDSSSSRRAWPRPRPRPVASGRAAARAGPAVRLRAAVRGVPLCAFVPCDLRLPPPGAGRGWPDSARWGVRTTFRRRGEWKSAADCGRTVTVVVARAVPRQLRAVTAKRRRVVWVTLGTRTWAVTIRPLARPPVGVSQSTRRQPRGQI